MTPRGGGALEYTTRGLRDRARHTLASDSVRGFIWVFYVMFIVGSIHLTFFAYPIRIIAEPLGGTLVYDAWAWMPLVAAPTALAGLALRHGGSPAVLIHGNLLRRDFLGLWMQVGGHVSMAIVLAVFIVTGWVGRDPGQPVPSVIWLIAYFLSVSFLAAQCLYKIRLGKQKTERR